LQTALQVPVLSSPPLCIDALVQRYGKPQAWRFTRARGRDRISTPAAATIALAAHRWKRDDDRPV